jgi:hypothetical protein
VLTLTSVHMRSTWRVLLHCRSWGHAEHLHNPEVVYAARSPHACCSLRRAPSMVTCNAVDSRVIYLPADNQPPRFPAVEARTNVAPDRAPGSPVTLDPSGNNWKFSIDNQKFALP